MKLSRVLAPIVAATVILTGCSGPSESDCTKALYMDPLKLARDFDNFFIT